MCRAVQSGATEPTRRDREIFSEKQLEDGYRLACQSYPTGAYEVEIPRIRRNDRSSFRVGEAAENGRRRTYRSEPKHQQKRKQAAASDKETAERTAEKTENALYGICIDIGTTTLAALLVNLETEADCQTAVSVNHQRAYGSDVLSRISASNGGKKVGDTAVYTAGSSETDQGASSKRKDNGTTDTKDRDCRKHNDVSSASRIFM